MHHGGGFNPGFGGGGFGGPPGGAAGRQIYVANVCVSPLVMSLRVTSYARLFGLMAIILQSVAPFQCWLARPEGSLPPSR